MLTIKASGYGLGGLFPSAASQAARRRGILRPEGERSERDATVRADLDGAQLNGMHVDPSTLKIKAVPKGSPLRVGDQILAINGERVEPDGAAGPLAALLRNLDTSRCSRRAPRDP